MTSIDNAIASVEATYTGFKGTKPDSENYQIKEKKVQTTFEEMYDSIMNQKVNSIQKTEGKKIDSRYSLLEKGDIDLFA